MKIKFGLKIRLEDTTPYKKYMTEDLAQEIKSYRLNGTWRYVASKITAKYENKIPDLGEDQYTGMQLCDSARAFLGEAVEPDWN